MSKKIRIAASCRKCGALPQDASPDETDAGVIAHMESMLEAVQARKPDLIVLPEMCDLPEGWGMETYVRYASARTITVLEYVREKARKLKAWIAYSTVRQLKDGTNRNSCILIDRQGNTAFIYDKMYPTLGELEAGILPGDDVKVLECELGRVGVAICFDLNYTGLAAEYQKKKADLLLFPSLFHGGLLQQMWAFGARAYLVGACGGCGASVVSPAGEVLEKSTGYFKELVYTVNLDYALVHLDFNWEKLRSLTCRYADSVTMHDPGGLGSVLLVNESSTCSMKEILEEFTVETMDDYLQRMKDGKLH